MASSLKWYASNVKGVTMAEANEKMWPVGMLVRRQARRNITQNGQIDTKFLWNSIYVAAPNKRTQTPAEGLYLSTKSGRMERRESGPIVQPREGVHVGVGADYGVYPELENSYLYRAIEQVAGRQAEDAMSGFGTGMFAGGGIRVMNDAADIVRDYLLTVPALTALTSTRIWAELNYPPAGYTPSVGGAILFKNDGTSYLAENAILRNRWQFKVYGKDVYQIRSVYSALMEAMHDTRGLGNIMSSQPQGPGALLEDAATNWPFRLEFIETAIRSGLTTYTPA